MEWFLYWRSARTQNLMNSFKTAPIYSDHSQDQTIPVLYHQLFSGSPCSLLSSTNMISFNNVRGDRLMTDQTVLNNVLHASLWNTITMLVSGRYLLYFLVLQPSNRISLSDRFNEIISLAIRLNWFSLNSSCCLASSSGEMCTAAPTSPGIPLFSRTTLAGLHKCNSDCLYRLLVACPADCICSSSFNKASFEWGKLSSVNVCCCLLFSVQPHPDPPMQSE